MPLDDEQLRQDYEEVWTQEVATLDELSDLRHPNFIQRIAAMTRGRQRCLMFLWADGGNLRDFWAQNSKPILTAEYAKQVIEQLRGIAEALTKLHGYKGSYHYRHGDLKPENILNFPDKNPSRIGTFKISDMGSAKHHSVATRLRERTGGKAFATMVYQPPESMTNKLGASSRRYDIWSMGCVTLEFIVWLLYGYEELVRFGEKIKGKLDEDSSFFLVEYEESQGISRPKARLHPAVHDCLESLSNDPDCAEKTALGDLLEIVRTKLLVVQLPKQSESSLDLGNLSFTAADAATRTFQPFGKHRTSAKGFMDALDDILRYQSTPGKPYWPTGRNRENFRPPKVAQPIAIPTINENTHLNVGWKPKSESDIDRQKPSSSTALSVSIVDISDQVPNVSAC